MAAELTVLALAGLLQIVQIALMAAVANRDLGPGYTMSARDRPPSSPPSELTGRLHRAMGNHFEGLILFTLAVVLCVLGGQSTGWTAVLAWTYLGARILYVPAYAFGWRPWRSVIWGVGLLATLLMILAALV